MILYHATKLRSSFKAIVATNTLLPGRNVSTDQEFVHLSHNPFAPGSYALDVIGADTNEAWVFTLEIPDDTPLSEDPSGEGSLYNGGWVVHDGPLAVTIISVEYIPNVQLYECGLAQQAR